MTKDTMRVTLARLSLCELQHRQLISPARSVDAEVTPMTLSTCILQQVLLTSVSEADTTKTTLYHLGRSGNEADTAPGEIL